MRNLSSHQPREGKRELINVSPLPAAFLLLLFLVIFAALGLDEETANFLLAGMPYEWQAKNHVTVGKMMAALTLVRQSASLMTLSYEERIRRALLILEPQPPPGVPRTS